MACVTLCLRPPHPHRSCARCRSPQRERRGWLGDAHISAQVTMYNFNMAGMCTCSPPPLSLLMPAETTWLALTCMLGNTRVVLYSSPADTSYVQAITDAQNKSGAVEDAVPWYHYGNGGCPVPRVHLSSC